MMEADSSALPSSFCPICGLPGLASTVQVCPQCDADLLCFRALEVLARPASPPPSPAPADVLLLRTASTRSSQRAQLGLVISAWLLGAVLLLLGVQVFLLLRLNARLAVAPALPREVTPPIRGTRKVEKVSKEEVPTAVAENQPTAHRPPPKSEAALYEARPEDNLWLIAGRFYGRGECYPLLLDDNPGASVYGIGAGVTLKVVSDTDEAAERCRKLIHRDGSGRFWYYSLRAKDSPESVARRYFGALAVAARIKQQNRHLPWKEGQRIKLYLP